jgi:predicted nucleotidyltransferase
MLKYNISKNSDSALGDVLARLKNNPSVDAVLLMGSTANKTMHKYSDYDLACVLRDAPQKIMGITSFIDHKFSEIFFYSIAEVEQAIKNESIDLNNKEGWIANWLRDGEIVCDKSGLLKRLKEKSINIGFNIDKGAIYKTWYRINYNLVQNSRYFESDSNLYHQALDIKLLYSILEVFTGYFDIRNISWTGEKNALKWLKENDHDFLKIFQSCLRVNDAEKFNLYKKLVELALKPVDGIWKKNTEAVMPSNDTDDAAIKFALDYWDGLVATS